MPPRRSSLRARLTRPEPGRTPLRARTASPPSDPSLTAPPTRPIHEEYFPVALAALLLAFFSFLICNARGYILLYGDAVAHLGIARRIFDSRNPGLAQLGGVWLPLPHLLMLPFIGRMEWWQNGVAGTWPSLACYILSVLGCFRLSRHLLSPRLALLATAFYALNPNLLYASTTALTEPLFLAILLWLTTLTLECAAAIRSAHLPKARRLLLGTGILILLAVYTRYDGWILGAAAWILLALAVLRSQPPLRRALLPIFLVFTLLAVVGPASWFWYNQHFAGDWLDFMRGQYSAAAIERKTSPPGAKHYRGWHNMGWSLLFYTRTAQVDASFWETGFLLLAAALAGTGLLLRRTVSATGAPIPEAAGLSPAHISSNADASQAASTPIAPARKPRRGQDVTLPTSPISLKTRDLALAHSRPIALLLWLPLPFYVYSVAYGSVPIFIPQLYPHSFYNARYGLELLPALSLFPLILAARLLRNRHPLAHRLFFPLTLSLVVLNSIAMIHAVPLVLQEGIRNARTRVPFEASLATELRSFPPGVPILMDTSAHIGAVQQAGLPLRQILDAGDRDSFESALASPATHAAYIIAIAGDPVSQAIHLHPEHLTELTVLCTTGQPCARIYRSDVWGKAK